MLCPHWGLSINREAGCKADTASQLHVQLLTYAVKFEQEETDGDVVRWWPAGSVRGPSVSVRGRCDADVGRSMRSAQSLLPFDNTHNIFYLK